MNLYSGCTGSRTDEEEVDRDLEEFAVEAAHRGHRASHSMK